MQEVITKSLEIYVLKKIDFFFSTYRQAQICCPFSVCRPRNIINVILYLFSYDFTSNLLQMNIV